MTERETEIIELLAQAYVMARLARRLHPEIFGKPKIDAPCGDLR